MTASLISSTFSANTANNKVYSSNSRPKKAFFQAEVTDFDGNCYTYEFEAYSEEEAHALALDACQSEGIDADYVCVYRYNL